MAGKSTKKKTSSKTNKKKNTVERQTNDNGLYGEIIILISLAVCILFVISNFGMGGIVGKAVSSVLFGIFGLAAYIIPVLLFCAIAFVISNKGNLHAYIKLGASMVLLVMVCTFLELVTNSYDSSASLMSCYRQASEHKNAGGFLGGCMVHLLCPLRRSGLNVQRHERGGG